jgi:hypothetical protein
MHCARDAVLAAQQYVQEGYRTVVDVNLSKFFDRGSHDIMNDRLRMQQGRSEHRADDCLLRPSGYASPYLTSTTRTAQCGPAHRVVWQGSS